MKRLIIGLALAGFTVGAPVPAQAQFDVGIPVGTAAPTVVINDLDGKPFDLADVVGKKPVFIEFWATWCERCEALLPRVKAAHAKYGDQVAWLGVNITVNQSVSRVRRYLETHAPPFVTLYDTKGAAVRAYDAPTTSFVVILDRLGKVIYADSGGDQDLDSPLARAVAGTAAPSTP